VQTNFLKALKATGKPVIFIMMTGSAIAIPWESVNIPAIINAWYGGQAAGTAVADVLFGDYSPAGRLPITFYKNDNDIPAFEDYSMTNRTYRYFKGEPLYPFGFGLSFATFNFSNIHLSKKSISKNENLNVEVTVTNTGKMKSDEVVELYLTHEKIAGAPLNALKGFKRIALLPGASQKVNFTISPEHLKLIDNDGIASFMPGIVKIIIGDSSPGKRSEDVGASKAIEATLILK
jgi:beta-glucosidase